MKIPEINTVCYVGAGTMGAYNSIVAAISGYEVVIFDIDADTLAAVPERQAEFAEFLVSNGYCPREAVQPALARVTLEPDLARATRSADLVSESIVERLDIKREVHRELDALCPEHTLLTTNTSALLVSDIEDVVRRGERFAALHSHLGAPLVDIVGGPRTSAATLEILTRYTESLGGVPLRLKREHPGYLLNSMLGPLMSAGMLLVSGQVASLEDVDRAWMHYRHAPMGPFAIIDLLGLNLLYDSWRYREAEGCRAAQREQVLSLLQPYIDSGALGMKSGRGFYQYPEPAYQAADFLDGAEALADVHSSLATILMANAVELAALKVAETDQIDMAWKVGTFLSDGPLELLESTGEVQFLEDLAGEVNAGRFEPDRAQRIRDYFA